MWQDLQRRFCFVLVIYVVEIYMGIDWGICMAHRRNCHVDVPSEKKLALTRNTIDVLECIRCGFSNND